MGRTQSRILTAVAFNNAWRVGSQALPSARRVKRVGFGFALNINNYILGPEGRANEGANGFPVGSRSHISTQLHWLSACTLPAQALGIMGDTNRSSCSKGLPLLFPKMTSKYVWQTAITLALTKNMHTCVMVSPKNWQFRHHGTQINSIIGPKDPTVFVSFD